MPKIEIFFKQHGKNMQGWVIQLLQVNQHYEQNVILSSCILSNFSGTLKTVSNKTDQSFQSQT